MTDQKLVLYEALKETVTRMRAENKFNHYQYKFNSLIFRGSENSDEFPFGVTYVHEHTRTEQSDIIRYYVVSYTVYHKGAYECSTIEDSYRHIVMYITLRIKRSGYSELSVNQGARMANVRPLVFPVEDYLGKMTIDDILSKFENEFMEVPPCALIQYTDKNGDSEVDFFFANNEEFLKDYDAIQRYYENEVEKKQLLMHKFKYIPSDLLKEYILKETQNIHSIIPHLLIKKQT